MCTIYNAKNIVINQVVIGHAEKIIFESNDQLKEFNDYFKSMNFKEPEQLIENDEQLINDEFCDYFTTMDFKDNKQLIENEREKVFDGYFANTIDFNSIYVL